MAAGGSALDPKIVAALVGGETDALEALTERERRVADVERRQAEHVDALEQRFDREREDERVAVHDSLTLQRGYAGLFTFAVLTTWGSLIA